VLAADVETQQARREVRLAGDGGATFDGRLDAAETRGVSDDPDRSAGRVGRLCALPHVEVTTPLKPLIELRAVAWLG